MLPPLRPPRITSWTFTDGYVAEGRVWVPAPDDPPPPATVLYLHGIQSHGGWYAGSASRIATGGLPVILADRRGSGRNEAARGDVVHADRWLADLDELAAWSAQIFGPLPLWVVGVSWGGKLALAWAQRRPGQIARLLLIAPGVFPAVDIGFAGRARVVAGLVGGGTARVPIPLNDPELFTDHPPAQTFIARDPLRLTHVTARFLWHSHRLDRGLRGVRDGEISIPTTLLLAAEDRIIQNGPTADWAARRLSPPATTETLPGRHTLEFAADPARFLSRIGTWAADAETR